MWILFLNDTLGKSLLVVFHEPMQSFANLTSTSWSLATSGFKLYLWLYFWLIYTGRPKLEARITRAWCSIKYLKVGTSAWILLSSAMLKSSFNWTFRSTLRNTFFSIRSSFERDLTLSFTDFWWKNFLGCGDERPWCWLKNPLCNMLMISDATGRNVQKRI